MTELPDLVEVSPLTKPKIKVDHRWVPILHVYSLEVLLAIQNGYNIISLCIYSNLDAHSSSKSERLKQVGVVVDSTPVLPDFDTVTSFLATQQHNFGIISILFEFVKLMALHYDHKW